jgi:hypothetical protein
MPLASQKSTHVSFEVLTASINRAVSNALMMVAVCTSEIPLKKEAAERN